MPFSGWLLVLRSLFWDCKSNLYCILLADGSCPFLCMSLWLCLSLHVIGMTSDKSLPCNFLVSKKDHRGKFHRALPQPWTTLVGSELDKNKDTMSALKDTGSKIKHRVTPGYCILYYEKGHLRYLVSEGFMDIVRLQWVWFYTSVKAT